MPTELGFDLLTGMPMNAYEELWQRLSQMPYRAYVAWLNGGDFASVFPHYLRDLKGMESLMLSIGGTTLKYQYPRINWLNKANQPMFIEAVSNRMHAKEMQHFNNVWDNIAAAELTNRLIDLGEQPVAKAEWLNANLSQHQRKVQYTAREFMQRAYMQGYTVMNAFCARNNCEFNLRPLIAFNHARSDDLRTLAPTRGISDPNEYMTRMFSAVIALVPAMATTPWADNYGDGYGMMNRHTYQWWYDTTAKAVIKMRDSSALIALIPSCLPSVLFSPATFDIPYYTRVDDTYLVHDQIAHVDYWRPGTEVNEASMDRFAHPKWSYAGELMAAMATVASILSAGVNLGKGHHKPAWVESPLNSEHVSFILINFARIVNRVYDTLGV